MSWAWAVSLDRRHAGSLAPLRLRAGLQALDAGGTTWLRGPELDDALRRELRKMPSARFHRVVEDGRLQREGTRIPAGSMPSGSWIGLSAWIRPEAPTAAFAGEAPRRLDLRLVRSCREEEPRALVCDLGNWGRFADSAAEVRLRGLAFAVRADGRILVAAADARGVVPSIRGTGLVVQSRVAWPCGFEWSPRVDGAVVAELLGLAMEDWALFSEDGSHEAIPGSAFVRASRSAVRLTLETAGAGSGGEP